MRIELTVRHRGVSHDLAIDAASDTEAGIVRRAVAAACGAPESALGPLSSVLRWGDAGLRDGALIDTAPASHVDPPGPAADGVRVVGGPNCGRCFPLGRGTLRIGRSADCDIVLEDADVSRLHASLEVTATSVTVADLRSTNGTTVDGVAVGADPVALSRGALLGIGRSLLCISPPADPPATVSPTNSGALHVSVPPRRSHPLPTVVLEAPNAASQARPRSVQWVTAVIPAAAGGALAWWTGTPQYLLFALLSPVMVLSGALGDRVHWRRTRRQAAAEYARRTREVDVATHRALGHETTVRRVRAPDAAEILRTALMPTDRLWERQRTSPDLLDVRLGTGRVESFALLREAGAQRPAGMLDDVPVGVDLGVGPLGLAGPRHLVLGLARQVLGQLATLCSPSDVRLAVIVSEAAAADWHWTRWLPHLGARVAVGPQAATQLLEQLQTQLPPTRRAADPDDRCRTVLLVDGGVELASVGGLASLLRADQSGAITAIVLAVDVQDLPASCVTVARAAGETGAMIWIARTGEDSVLATADLVDEEWAERLARSLAPLTDGGDLGSGPLPDSCTLDDVHDLHGAAGEPPRSRGGAVAVIGVGPDGPLELDLAAEGPHALVAGTTGSGKSELLQALVIGLALRQSTAELTVLLIDYKGGAAFGGCARLPHSAGLVTDLDPYLTRRALRSLTCELRRRETLLADSGVADLTAYRLLGYATSIPRLVIVVDEFAALAEELPDFVRGLIAVAQRGRSLGVHLVLATQRPGSAVSPDIRANTSLRIALRVTDPAESIDVIGVPDAATILRSTPGRAYIRTDSALRPVQTAWPGADTTVEPSDVRVELLPSWRRPGPLRAAPEEGCSSDLDRVVDELCRRAERLGERSAATPWTPVLPEVLPRSDLAQPPSPTTVVLGLVDLPDEQRHDLLSIDLTQARSLLIVGASRSGRTTALISLVSAAATQLTPEEVELYTLDPLGRLAAVAVDLPHCVSSVDGTDPELLLRLLLLLGRECSRRSASHDGADPPMILLVDSWDVVLAALSDGDALRCAAELTSLLRLGPAAGLTVVLTGDRTLLSPRVAASFAERVALRLADPADYAALGVSPRDVPNELTPGRGVRSSDGAVVQFALPPATTTPRAGPAQVHRSGRPRHGVVLRELPSSIALRQCVAPPDAPAWLALGLAGDLAAPLHIDPWSGAGRLLVAGPARSGRSTLLRVVLIQAVGRARVLVACGPRSPLLAAARTAGVELLDPHGDGDVHVPSGPTVLLVDDCEAWADTPLADTLTGWLRRPDLELAAVVAGRSDDLFTTYRGLGAEARRQQCGVLLRPGPVDGDLLGVRLPRRPATGPPGRGVVLGDPSWGPQFAAGEPVTLQVAQP